MMKMWLLTLLLACNLLYFSSIVQAYTANVRTDLKRNVRIRNRSQHAATRSRDILQSSEGKKRQAIAMGILSTFLANSNPDLARANTPEVSATSITMVSNDPAIRLQTYLGNYADPNHPGCLRKVEMDQDRLVILGSDSVDGSNPWLLRMKESEEGKFLVDFSPKGGPKNLLGKFDCLCEVLVFLS